MLGIQHREERDMVFRKSDGGGGWHEPPYTKQDEREFYRRYNAGMASGKATIYRGPPAAAGKPVQPQPARQKEK
jgi:hypothetical protein